MNEEALKEAFNLFVQTGYDGDINKFKNLISTNPEALKEAHNLFVQTGYDGDINKFKNLIGVGQQQTTQIQSLTQQPPAKKKELSASLLEGGLSGFLKSEQPKQEYKPTTPIPGTDYNAPQNTPIVFTGQQEEDPYGIKRMEQQMFGEGGTAMPKGDYFAQVGAKEKKEAKIGLEYAIAKEETKKLQQKEQTDLDKKLAENLAIKQSPEFANSLNKIDQSIYTQDDYINNLNREYQQYGVTVTKGGWWGEKLIARTDDGKKMIEINTLIEDPNERSKDLNSLKKFISENAKISKEEDFLSQALRAKNMRSTARINDDGTQSTVKFISFDNKVIPTLFPKTDKWYESYSSDKKDWIELPFDEALKEATKRGEVFTFKTNEEAEAFAKGAWKDISKLDVEGDKFYRSKGRDYITEKKRWERYDEIDDIINFYEGDQKDMAEFKKQNPTLFVNGMFRTDIDQYIGDLKKERESLRPLVKDMTFFSQEGTSEKSRMDFDFHLAEMQKKASSDAAAMVREAKAKVAQSNQESMEIFGVPIDKLTEDKEAMRKNPQAYVKAVSDYTNALMLGQTATIKYTEAQTYFDAKINKDINNRFTEDGEAVYNSIVDGYNNGLIGDQLLALTIPGYSATSGFSSKEDAARYMAEKLAGMSQGQSRVMTRLESAKTARDWWDVMMDDPFEGMALAVAGSISQMLPYGTKITVATTAAGAGTGALVGLAGGPFAPVTVTGGAISGGLYGLRTGQALTGAATEYTTAFMDAVRNQDYNPLDPKSLEAALNDQDVWDEAARVGAARGIPIAVVDYLTAGLAGNILKPSKLASRGTKITRGIAENVVLDPLMESGGELAAQTSEMALGTGRKELSWSEIALEGIGSMGTNTPNFLVNTYKNAKENTDIDLAYSLTNAKNVAKEKVSDERISNWANNMFKLGKIDESVNQRIQENVGLRRSAKEVLSVGEQKGKASPEVTARTMELLSAKEQLSATKNRQEVYGQEIRAINEELAAIGKSKQLLPKDQQVNLEGLVELVPESERGAVGEYMIDGKRYTKQQFLDRLNSIKPERLSRVKIAIKGDPEVSQTFKEKIDAIQKQTTGEVSVQPEAGAGQEVEVGGPEAKPKITPEESKRKEDLVAALEATDKDVIAIGDELLDRKEAQTELDALVQKEQAVSAEQGGAEQAPAKMTPEEIEQKRQGDLKKSPVSTFMFKKINPNGENLDVNDKQKDTIERIIQQAIEAGKTADEIVGVLNAAGYVATYPGNTGAADVSLRTYLENRLAGTEKRNVNEYASTDIHAEIKTKYDAELAALQAAPTEGLGTQLEMVAKEEQTPAEVTPAEITPTEVTPTTEVTPVEQQFTEQDRARKAELEEAMRKADKRRKNITVGETTMPKAEAKAELDALNQKEQAAQQLATPAVEVAPAELTPTEEVVERTPEQEADLLEELLTGKKKEPVAEEVVAEGVVAEEKVEGKKLSDMIRGLEIKGPGGLQSNLLGIPIAIWNSAVKTTAAAIDANVAVAKAIQQGVKEIKDWINKNNPSLSLNDAKIKNTILVETYAGVIKTARENNIKNEGLTAYFKRKGLSDVQISVLFKAEQKEATELSEKTIPGYTKLMNRINGIIERGRRNGKTDDDIMKGVIANVESRSPEYANANDQQREQIIRDIRKLFGKKEKAAPSAEKITGKAKPKKVTVDEMTALKDQLRLEAKAAREAKGDLNTKRKMLADAINKMAKKGSISVRQAKAIVNRISSVNLDNPVMVERLLDYAEKVFNDAAYAEKLSQANKLQSQIKQLSKNKDKFGNLTAFAAEFAKIDPALVENIDEYIEMASKVKEGVQGSKTVNGKVIPADMVDVGATMEYVNETMKAQEETIRLKTAERLQDLMGVDVSDLSMAKLQELMDLVKAEALAEGEQKETLSEKIDAIFGANKDKEKAIRDGIQRMFDTYSTIIKDMFETGIDPFSDPDNPTTVEFKDSDKKIVEDFMGMDLSLLDKKEALRAADALNNFLTNKSTAGMVAVFAEYTGRNNNKEVNKEGIKAEQIKMYWSSVLGLTYFQQFASIPLFFERLFKSYKKGRYIREMMGINSLINHKADAVTAANRIINNYIIEFSKKKPNNKNFQDIYNIIERGIIGDLAKTIVGDAKQVEAEFNRRKKLIEETIKILEDAGTNKELEQAKVIKEVYDNIARDSKTIEEVKEKADNINVDAVNFWVDQWAKLFDKFADVALNVYNKVLDKNVNYVPDRFGFLERAEKKQKDADGVESMFFANSNSEYFYKKEAGSLRKSTPPTTLLDSDGNSRDMYVNLSFDTNNANALLEALIDIKTAADIRQIQAFKNDPGFKNIFPFGKDAAATKERIATLIRNIRNKRTITDKTFRDLTKKLDRIAAIGTSLVLAGPSQAISQTLPVAVNTFINSGGKLNLSTISNKDVNRLIDESGMGIANRGTDAVTELETLNQKLEVAAKTKVGAVTQYIENLNRAYLKVYLSNFDVFIARASWITYYEKSLRKQGIKGNIDYSTHKLNKEAAQYAQDMIDRQQNISDKDLAGQLYQSDNPLKQLFVKVIMPLTTFRMNQTTRFSNDLAILSSKTSSNEDKVEAVKSLGGFAAEMATFRLTKLYIGYYVFYSLAQFIRGEEEDEEEKKKKWNNMVKGAITSSVPDIFSPIPQTDMPTKYIFSSVLDQLQALGGVKEEDRFNIFTESKESFASDWGLLGIGIDKLIKLRDNIELARTGKFKDEYGREKTIREKDRKLLSDPRYIGISIATLLGINPFSPETDNVMNNITKMIKKDAMTEKQLEEYKETGEYPTKKSEAVKEKEGVSKAEAYGGYKTIEEFEEKDPIKYDEYSAKGGKLYKYREDERKKDEEKNKDQPFRGLSEKQFKEYYPEEWRKYYGPGTGYFQRQNSPAMLQKKEQEKIREAQLDQKRKIAAAKREQQEALKKALGK